MQKQKLEKCLLELKKPNKNRNQGIILDYLATLELLINSIKLKHENYEEALKKLSSIMAYEKFNKNDLIFQYGDKVKELYIILNGKIQILTPKYIECYMNEEEFILYLLKLRKHNQKEFLNQCIKFNAIHFSYTYEFLTDFLFNLEKKRAKIESTFKNAKITKEAKDIIKYLKTKGNINDNQIRNISAEDYISLSEIDKKIKRINNDLKQNLIVSIEGDRKLVKLLYYKQISLLKEGEIFGENIIEYTDNKLNETIIAYSDCDLVKINKLNYNDLMKASLAKIKNKFFNLIQTYKIFMNIPYSIFDKKYYHHFRYLKLIKNQLLFKEGDICDNIFFISNGEYEIYVDKSIEEINEIVSRMKSIIDDLKKYILTERKKIMNKNINKKNIYLKLKNNLDQFFNQFESEINLEEIAFQIQHKDIIDRKKFFEKEADKIFSTKRRIKLGIFKSRQIIGLNDLINRDKGNICIFNCKCSSFEGELCYVPYNKFLTIYDIEDKVSLYTSELLFQNIYYIIGRLVSHKKFIINNAKTRENDLEKIFSDDDNNKSSRNKIINKAKVNIINIVRNIKNEESKNSICYYSNKNNQVLEMNLKSIVSYINNNSNSTNNIYGKRNKIKIKKEIIRHNISGKKDYNKEETNDVNDESHLIKSTSKNTFKNMTVKSELNSKSLKFNIEQYSRNIPQKNPLLLKDTRSDGMNTINSKEKMEIPILVINNNEVKIKEDLKDVQDNNNKTSYKNFVKYVNNLKDDKMANLVNNNELKNIILFGNFNEKIERKLNLELLKRTKNLLLKRKNVAKTPQNKEKFFDINKYNFQVIPYSDKKSSNKKNNEQNNLKNKFNKTRMNMNDVNVFKKGSITFQRRINNIIFNRQNQLSPEKSSFDSKNISFNNERKKNSMSQNLLFRNTFLKKNLSDFPFLNETNNKEEMNKKFFSNNIRNKIYHFKNLRKRKNRFIQTPSSFMNSFNLFVKKMEKLNIDLK